ncbi:hypothetical protein BJF79_18755 [Actinomadura sp. CNU-125]|nr:hypothetical protein BJF79_18755 [Actinomadura sp. CNU-125]
MPRRRTDRNPIGSASSAANAAPPRIATGNGRPECRAIRPVAYAEPPQKAACPNDSSPVKPSSRSTATANSAQQTMSIATGG